MTQDELLIQDLQTAFAAQNLTPCLDTESHVESVIVDQPNNNPCIFVLPKNGEQVGGFTVQNPSAKQIYLLRVDHCLMGLPGKRCDCIVFDNVFFCFVELKLDVSRFGQIADKARDAREQLGETIRYFDAALQGDYKQYQREAYVVMHRYPRRPNQIVRERFFEQYRVQLFEETSKTF